MPKLTKRFVEAVEPEAKGQAIWDDELPGFGLRVYPSGKRSYIVQYRARGRSRRYTIGLHGVWTPETARREAKALLGHVARGNDPAEERDEDRKALTVKQLCEQYIEDMEAGLIMGKGGRPKKASTIEIDVGRIRRHIIPLLGTRRVRDITKPDMNNLMKDIIAGKTRVVMKTEKLRGKAIVRGGRGTAIRTMGLLGGIFSYAVESGVIDHNPTHGLRKPKYQVRDRRLSEAEYRILGGILRQAQEERPLSSACRDPLDPRRDRLPTRGDHQSQMERGRHRRELPAADRQQGRRVGASDRPSGDRVPGKQAVNANRHLMSSPARASTTRWATSPKAGRSS